jgi:hypothetical protein
VKTKWACIVALLLAAAVSAFGQTPEAKSVPCDARSAPKGWRTYVDRTHGFCFRYPPIYKRVPNQVHKEWLPTFHLVTFQRLHSDAHIFVSMDGKAFDSQRFVETAPTGIDSPPEPIHIGQYTFYYYGPGGGGVEYADAYFFNLRGKTLTITFDGPYDGDKTPSAETKKLEREILATFSTA